MNQRYDQTLKYAERTLLFLLFVLSVSFLSKRAHLSEIRSYQTVHTSLSASKTLLASPGLKLHHQLLSAGKNHFPFFSTIASASVRFKTEKHRCYPEKERRFMKPLVFPGFCYFSHRRYDPIV